jgi:colanic acid/amylovoran biosynthesis glycosyltransferase
MANGESASLDLTPLGPIAYLMPEFPDQPHTWFDREVFHMREFGVDVRLFSTRPPPHESAARHAFAKRAREETIYLWPRPVSSILAAIRWALFTRPHRLVRAAVCGLTLDDMSPRERAGTLPFLGAACVLAREARGRWAAHLDHGG